MTTADIVNHVRVPRPPEDAFELFTAGIDRWWPLDRYSYGGGRSSSIHLEPWVGGRFYEELVDGDVVAVGTVVECDPPRGIVFSWAGPQWAAQTEVTVRFTATADGTEVSVEHRFFDRLGPDADQIRSGFAGGWTEVIGRYTQAATAEP